jgi:GT2 family glycosyltransferase
LLLRGKQRERYADLSYTSRKGALNGLKPRRHEGRGVAISTPGTESEVIGAPIEAGRSAPTANGRGPAGRPGVLARFVRIGGEKQYLRGVTYGTFCDGPDGAPYPDPATVGDDFAAMAAAGVNAIRLYTAPPRWLLDLAHEHGLCAMVGLAWEDHVAFLDDRQRAARIVKRVEQDAAACAGHPALLCYAVGNEIPASIVRWHGARKIERFVERLYSTVKRIDPGSLVTYVNYPSTEYLQLPFLDLVCFNVYLESDDPLQAYLARLHNIAGDRPLLITEIGLDSKGHGLDVQARVLERQLRTAYASGCAGAFVFSWTDEWHRGGIDVDDWHFGLVDHERRPKPALAAVERAFTDVPLAWERAGPRISVVVCSYNGEATIGRCLQALTDLDYPDYEVIVVDDGSTDGTASIAAEFDVRLIRTDNHGLSAARNTGIEAATGEIVAFTDDDSWPDADWLRYLAHAFCSTDHAGIGGPNLVPDDAGTVESAVARSPGGPTHVLLSDDVAEHIPGCNMAFRSDALKAVGGFDPQFRIAGDDVDICWRLQERGWTIGFCPAAVVLHRRRHSVRRYLKQQMEYGKAEALLECKWPEKYNRGGHLAWEGRMYASTPLRRRRGRIGYGTWGSNLFQSLYDRTPSTLGALPLMPEWYLLIGLLAVLSIVGIFQHPLVPWTSGAPVRIELLLLAAAAVALAVKVVRGAWHAPHGTPVKGPIVKGVTAVLFLLQPVARLTGRMRGGLTPWRRRGEFAFALPLPRRRSVWSEHWRSPTDRLLQLERDLRARCMNITRGGDSDRWDIQVRLGPLGSARMRVAVEEHGQGRQLVRYQVWPRWSRLLPAIVLLSGAWLAGSILFSQYLLAASIFVVLLFLVLRASKEAGAGVALVLSAIGDEVETDRTSGEPHELMDDLRVMPVPSAVETLPDQENGSHPPPGKTEESLGRHR